MLVRVLIVFGASVCWRWVRSPTVPWFFVVFAAAAAGLCAPTILGGAALALLCFEAWDDGRTGWVETENLWVACFLALASAFLTGQGGAVLWAVLVCCAGAGAARLGWMGDGDGPALAVTVLCGGLWGLASAFLLGGLVAACGLISGRLRRGDWLPLVPFLAFGAVIGSALAQG